MESFLVADANDADEEHMDLLNQDSRHEDSEASITKELLIILPAHKATKKSLDSP